MYLYILTLSVFFECLSSFLCSTLFFSDWFFSFVKAKKSLYIWILIVNWGDFMIHKHRRNLSRKHIKCETWKIHYKPIYSNFIYNCKWYIYSPEYKCNSIGYFLNLNHHYFFQMELRANFKGSKKKKSSHIMQHTFVLLERKMYFKRNYFVEKTCCFEMRAIPIQYICERTYIYSPNKSFSDQI